MLRPFQESEALRSTGHGAAFVEVPQLTCRAAPSDNTQMAARVVILLAFLALSQASPVLADAGFRKAGDMVFRRSSHAAVVLPDSGVLVVSDTTAERYDSASNTFTVLGSLTTNRGVGLTATLLADGRVLIVGGQPDISQSSAELYDPVAATFSPTGSMATARSFHTATRLADGRVLVTGGHQFNFFNSALSTAEIYDPGSGSFAPVGSMSVARQDHTATLLSDGRVLIAGGYSADQFGLTAVEIFDPVTSTFAATDSLAARRGNHIAMMLPNGNVLIAGGHTGAPADSLSSAEVYDAASGRFTPTGNMTVARGSHAAALLSDGTVLIAGGYTAFPLSGTTLPSAEIYNPMAGSFAPTATMPVARGRFIAAPLASGDVLVAGGFGECCVALANAEVFSTLLVDTEPPLISVPGDFSVIATGPDGVLVFYFASATDDIDASPQLVCDPLSGSLFPVGMTTVVCTAIDSASNTSSASFHVTVIEPLDIAVTIDPSGSVDSKSGIATVTGTVSCSRPTQFVNIFGRLVQIIANRATLNADYFVQTSCSPGALVAWSTTVTSPNGRFKAGKADASASAFACDGLSSCDSSNETRTIVLRSNK